ncbi:aldose 1-epimerase family protein [uncultured Olsenella sp.]|uniref:aldose 1-epimerase family protein n=1 Tax=uncultured Olsenella sp. TaxID=190764 RepID=UPI0026DC8E54|nr:aldose 1-epimerase family protein [uncultured Olsenella sp.]
MEDTARISSGQIEAEVSRLGAQLMSLKAGGTEYLWQGDPRWWPRRAPVLFPIVGNLRGDHATSARGEIRLGRHGLARNEEFSLVEREENRVLLELESNEGTRRSFPYDFRLRLSYAIDESSLVQGFEVTNTGSHDLPYVLGGHPAFNVPAVGASDGFDAYRLEFAEPWTYAAPRIDVSTGLLDFQDRLPLLDSCSVLPLTHRTFDVDTLVFEDVPQRRVRLVGPEGHGIRVDFAGFDYLGVWSAAGDAPFVALEPWTGCATAEDEDDVFEHKRGMRLLSPGQTDRLSFVVTPF